jgi:hypothetical protein
MTSAPYNGTAGYVPVEQSKEAAEQAVESGALARRQRRILQILAERGPIGATSAEIEVLTGEHHGKVSGALSSMHKGDAVVALKLDRRNGSGVYVLHAHVLGRIVRPFKSIEQAKAGSRMSAADRELVEMITSHVTASGDTVVRLKPSTARALLALIRKLESC